MSQENVEIVRTQVKALVEGGYLVLRQILALVMLSGRSQARARARRRPAARLAAETTR